MCLMLLNLCKQLQVCATGWGPLFLPSDNGWIYCAARKAPAPPLQVMQAAKPLKFFSPIAVAITVAAGPEGFSAALKGC